MRTHALTLLLASLSLLLFIGDHHSSRSTATAQPADREARRIRFDVKTFEERSGHRDLISAAIIDGPEGTDFQIKLHGSRFQMDARFLTDASGSEAMKIRAALNTRRLYGYSERELPLYEEDSQQQTLILGFDEKMVLLPFGQTDTHDQLRIEITPNVSDDSVHLSSGERRPLKIKIEKPSPGGTIQVEAWKAPHRFLMEAMLLEDGREIASSESDTVLIEQPQEIDLKRINQGGNDDGNDRFKLKLAIDRYMRSRPTDQVELGFDFYSVDPGGGGQVQRTPYHAAGVAGLGEPLVYDLSSYFQSSPAKHYELRLRVKLAPGEEPN